MGNLITTTIVPAPQMDGGESYRVFGPDDDVPEWAARQMGAHMFEGGEHPYPDEEVQSEREPGAIPARHGKGSGRDAWAAYANDVEVDVPADAGRDQIIELITAAGKPVENES